MKRLILTTVTAIAFATMSLGQCTSLFSFAAYFNTVTFVNQSAVSNAHYFWNFGDGTGSNFVNPVHTFPGTGDYLVTLFAKDTISNCSSYYEYWVDVTKFSVDPCQPSISDSIYTNSGNGYLYIYNTSANCNGDSIVYSGGGAANFPSHFMPVDIGNSAYCIVCAGDYRYGVNLIGSAYKTAQYDYSSSHNYYGCSANFEFMVVSKDSTHERILFTAMNKTATFYQWYVTGFGNPITSNYDTISQLYPFTTPATIWAVALLTQDSAGCGDTITQDILVGDSIKTVLGISDITANKAIIKVYPNPSNGLFTLQINGQQSAHTDYIQVYNVLGQQVYQSSITANSTEINLSGQPQGVYLYRLITETGELVGEGKLVLQ